MESNFQKAAAAIKQHKPPLSNEELLQVYAFFKQGTEGKNTRPKPTGMFAMKDKAKWEAWSALGDMSKEDAQAKYVELVKKYLSTEQCEGF